MKQKRYYKKGEIVFLHKQKTTGKVIEVLPQELSVLVSVKSYDNKTGKMISIVEKVLLEDVDKYKPAKFNVRVKYLDGQDKKLQIEELGDWIDVYTNEDVTLAQFGHTLIPLGFALEVPKGHEAFLAPRSSTFPKHGVIVANSFGIIDNTYSGDEDEWKLSVIALRDTFIPKGTKIAQFRFVKSMTDHDGTPSVKFREVDTLGNESRGGFGTTGQ